MQPVTFPQANTTFRPPSELDASQCKTIPAFVGKMGGNLDGLSSVVVAWELTDEDIETLKNGDRLIYLTCLGGLPPHMLSVGFPLKAEV